MKQFSQLSAINNQHIYMQSWIEILQYWVHLCLDSTSSEYMSRMGISFFAKRYNLARICDDVYNPEMICQVAEAICHIPISPVLASAIARIEELPDISFVEQLCAQSIDFQSSSRSNLRRSLQQIQCVHNVSLELHRLKNTAVSYQQTDHIQMLDRLWFAAFPNKVNFFEDWSERDWGEIGFQKKNDPVSDLRGLGLLGLQQLVYFFETRPLESHTVLKLSRLESGYFPLAATALSIGAFSLSLLKEHRLHRKILNALDTYELVHSLPPLDDEEQRENHRNKMIILQNVVFETFCDLLERFASLWRTERASNVMDFPRVFTMLQQNARKDYPRLNIALEKLNIQGASVVQTASIVL